jgi:O-methyltransferase involved in polyketide biosynthesis
VTESAAQLSAVSKSLFLTLRSRVRETQQPGGLFVDSEAVRLFQSFGHALPQAELDWKTHVGTVIRTDIFDREVRRHLASAPSPLIVNLGAGLCTRYYRLGQPTIDWIEIDYPDVIALRRGLLPESARHRMIACSVTDHAWIDRISPPPGASPLFVAEGLLWYLRDAEVKELLTALNRRFAGGRFLTDAPSALLSALYRWHPGMRIAGIRLQRGTIGSQARLDRWSRGISIEREWRQYDEYPQLWGRMAFLRHVPDLREWGKVVSLRFNGEGTRI